VPSGALESRAYYKRRFQDTRKNRQIAGFGSGVAYIATRASDKKAKKKGVAGEPRPNHH